MRSYDFPTFISGQELIIAEASQVLKENESPWSFLPVVATSPCLGLGSEILTLKVPASTYTLTLSQAIDKVSKVRHIFCMIWWKGCSWLARPTLSLPNHQCPSEGHLTMGSGNPSLDSGHTEAIIGNHNYIWKGEWPTSPYRLRFCPLPLEAGAGTVAKAFATCEADQNNFVSRTFLARLPSRWL